MEDGDSVRHLNIDSSFDCHEHVLLQGIWASEHLKRGKKVGAISYDIGHFLQNAMINKKNLLSL